MKVDFDAEANRLVFSRDSVDMSNEQLRQLAGQQSGQDRARLAQEMKRLSRLHEETIERLAQQAMPAQIRILEQFGTSHVELANMRKDSDSELGKESISSLKGYINALGGDPKDCLEKSDLVKYLQEVASKENVWAVWASAKFEAPNCVCGSSLIRVNGNDRLRRQCKAQGMTDAQVDRCVNEMRARRTISIICDLCDTHVKLQESSIIWTCENGTETILHATAYDICNDCFVRHTCVPCSEASSTASDSSPQLRSARRSGEGYA